MLGAYTVGSMYNIKEIETWRFLLISFLGISFLIEYTKEVKRDVIKNQDEI
jgi:putative Mn2+ efflux pump MntP